MSQVVTFICDNCAKPDAEHIGPLDLGDGPYSIDLCPDCQSSLGLNEWEAWLDEYGVKASKTVAKTPAGYRAGHMIVNCPVCHNTLSSRQYGVTHLETVHGMDPIEASRAIPPNGPARDCEHCGVLVATQGYAGHIRFRHAGKVVAA